jgi:hypothetical protein
MEKFVARFITLAQCHIDNSNVATKVGQMLIGMGLLFSGYELLRNGLSVGVLVPGGLTVAAGILTTELERGGRMSRRSRMLARADTLRLQNGMPKKSVDELDRFLDSNRSAIRHELSEHSKERD